MLNRDCDCDWDDDDDGEGDADADEAFGILSLLLLLLLFTFTFAPRDLIDFNCTPLRMAFNSSSRGSIIGFDLDIFEVDDVCMPKEVADGAGGFELD